MPLSPDTSRYHKKRRFLFFLKNCSTVYLNLLKNQWLGKGGHIKIFILEVQKGTVTIEKAQIYVAYLELASFILVSEEHRHGSTRRSCRFLLHHRWDINVHSSSCSLLPLFLLFFWAIFLPFPPSPPPRGIFLGSIYRLSCGKYVISLLLWVYFLKKTHLLLCLTSYFTANLEAESCYAVIYIHFQ